MLSFETIGTSSLQPLFGGVANGTTFCLAWFPRCGDHGLGAFDCSSVESSTRPCNLVQLLLRLREPS